MFERPMPERSYV